jgi:AAA lid domain/ATPase family associated with various cellular activities (AAA)
MFSPERLNVLLSRARNGLIMIGNTRTFTESRKGGQLWTKLVGILKENGNLYNGLPVVCGRHPDRKSLLMTPEDFDKDCPDGGCSLPWYEPSCFLSYANFDKSFSGTMLKCGQHACPSKCHQLANHSMTPCDKIMNNKCSNGHTQQWKCSKGPPSTCAKCERERELVEKKQREQFVLQAKRDAAGQAHAHQMAELDAQLAQEREHIRATREAEERKRALEQKRLDVHAAQEQARSTIPPSVPIPLHPTVPPQTQNDSYPSIFQSISGFLPSWTGLTSPSNPTTPTQPNISLGKTPPATKTMAPKRSAAHDEWQYQKSVNGIVNPAIDAIMAMIGLEDVKKQMLSIRNKVDTSIRQGTDLKGERFNVSMLGNPGTGAPIANILSRHSDAFLGKTTVARHYARFLASVQVIPNDTFFETTGSRLANDGVPGIKAQVEKMLATGGGVIFVDEAYQLTSDSSGHRVLDFILAEMENSIGKLVWIFAGYNREMEKFFEHNPGLQSRVPYTLQFKDYEDGELLHMLQDVVEKQWSGRMKVEDGILGLYGRIAVRRLGWGRGRNGFGNARALRNLFDKIRERQSERLTEDRRAGKRLDDFLLVKEDLIGPEPATVMAQSKAWKALNGMIGLNSVKNSVKNLFDMTILNYRRELQELEPDVVSLNRVFLGSPGTGKTTVAKYYGQLLAELGLLSNGEGTPVSFFG